MNFTRTEIGDLPKMTLSTDELTDLITAEFVERPGSYYFTSFTKIIADNLIKNQFGFKSAPNTIYQGDLNQGDKARVREIIWDMIIARYLTIGGGGHNEWPGFSVTERGKTYFESMKKNLL